MSNNTHISLYPHQREAIEKLHNGSILVGGVGSGKTLAGIGYVFSKIKKGKHPIMGDKAYSPGEDKPVYVITTARKRHTADWERESSQFFFIPTVDSWNNIQKYVDVENAFFIFDEQRLVGHGAWVKAFYKIAKKNQWILLTATPGDSWKEYIPVFIANGFYKNKTSFEREHVSWSRFSRYPKIEKYLNVPKLIEFRKRIVVPMPHQRKTKRHINMVRTDYNKKNYNAVWVDRWNIFKDRPIKNSSELIYTIRKIVNSDPSRLHKLLYLWGKHRKIIVFYNFDYELYLLEEFSKRHNITYKQWNGHKHEDIPTGDMWLYLCQYTSAAEAWSAPETDTIVFFSQNYSYKILEQASGRIDRLTSKHIDLYYYNFVSFSRIDNAIRKALSEKRNFNEANFMRF